MSAQFGEDAILARLFATIGTTNRFTVECGARDGVANSSTHQLRVAGWTCVLLDAHPQAPIVDQVFLTAENIEATFAAHRVPATFDLLSIDIDGNDFWIWRALTAYVPRVVVIEYNSSFGQDERRVIIVHTRPPASNANRWAAILKRRFGCRRKIKLISGECQNDPKKTDDSNSAFIPSSPCV